MLLKRSIESVPSVSHPVKVNILRSTVLLLFCLYHDSQFPKNDLPLFTCDVILCVLIHRPQNACLIRSRISSCSLKDTWLKMLGCCQQPPTFPQKDHSFLHSSNVRLLKMPSLQLGAMILFILSQFKLPRGSRSCQLVHSYSSGSISFPQRAPASCLAALQPHRSERPKIPETPPQAHVKYLEFNERVKIYWRNTVYGDNQRQVSSWFGT